MSKKYLLGLFAAGLCASAAAQTSVLTPAQLTSLVRTFEDIHAHPELSGQEKRTAALLAKNLREVGYTVTEGIGKYPDGTRAHGVVAILENGPGPRLLIRADMDALPILEETGLAYASTLKTRGSTGENVGVMHACGHDAHVTSLIGTARMLAAQKDRWHGTVMLIGQPAEETLSGARAMLEDGLYERFGTPDFALALHSSVRPAGTVAFVSGATLASSTMVDVVLHGVGGHGARPHEAKDAISMAGQFLVQLQTIVSRQEDPRDPTVITVGTIHGGTKRNIIADEVRMELTVRSFSDQGRRIALDGIRRIAQAVASSAGVPKEREQVVNVLLTSSEVVYNDPELNGRVKAAVSAAIGASNVLEEEPIMGGEDFGLFALKGRKIPSVFFWLGTADPQRVLDVQAEGKVMPGTHTSQFRVEPAATLSTGVTAMTSAALALLAK